jgi:hypothetical protein
VAAVTEAAALQFAVRPLDATDALAVRALFQQVFDKPLSQALWDWKYRRPQSAMVGVFQGEQLIAHYGGIGVDIYWSNMPATAMQIVDVMVSPSVRHAVRGNSPFFLAGSTFLDAYVGHERPYLLGYGFPSERHLQLAEHLKLYAAAGHMRELEWEFAKRPHGAGLMVGIDSLYAVTLARHRPAIDSLWQQQRRELRDRIVVRKDAAWLLWRYLRHPEHRYEVLLAKRRITGTPLGICVLKEEGERLLLMDLIGPRKRMGLMVQVAQEAAWRKGKRKLALWCSDPDMKLFRGFKRGERLPITTPANIRTPGPSPSELKDRWWLMAGDTDYL